MYKWGRNFLKRKLSPPHPFFKELSNVGSVLGYYIVRSTVEELIFALYLCVVRPFKTLNRNMGISQNILALFGSFNVR